MKVCIIIVIIGLILIIDSLFDVLRQFGLNIPRKYTVYFAPLGFLLIVIGLFLSQRGLC